MNAQTGLRQYVYPSRRFFPALCITLLMAFVYTVLDTLQPEEPLLSILSLLPGSVAVAALLLTGLTREDLYLRFSPISRGGIAALAVTTVLLLPILGSRTGFTGWRWLPALVYAPASGIAQELFFRSSLLPGLEHALGGRKRLALLVHSAIFVAFHFRTFRYLPSFPIALLVALVLFTAGCGWGWQVQRDRTVIWTMIQHSAFLVLMSMFDWV